MKKFARLKFSEVKSKKISDFKTQFAIEPLERGMANTLGNTLRRVLLSSIQGVAPFAVIIKGAEHEFQALEGVTEDVVRIILNLKQLRVVYNHEIFGDEEVVKISLNSSPKGEVLASNFSVPAGVKIVNEDLKIATTSKADALKIELFLISGRGFVSFEENKELIKTYMNQIDAKINGAIIAVDSDFSPVKSVSYESVELNTSAAIIQEKLTLDIETDGSVDAKDALGQAADILVAHFGVIADISNLDNEEIFNESVEDSDKKVINKSVPISQLELSVRSYNSLKRAEYNTLEQLSKMTKKELKEVRNLGKKSEEEIIEKLAQYGIELEEGE